MADNVGLEIVKYEGGLIGFMKKFYIWFQKNEDLKAGNEMWCSQFDGYDVRKSTLPIARNAPLLHLFVYHDLDRGFQPAATFFYGRST
jgi:hypothetical protein